MTRVFPSSSTQPPVSSSAVMDGALLAVLSVVSLGVELVPVSELPPQAVRDSANISASTSAVIFFIFCFFS